MKIKSIRLLKQDSVVPVYDVVNSLPHNNFLIKTNGSYVISHNCSAIIDEISFAPGQSTSYQSSKVMSVYTNIRRRMESRFMVQGRNYGLMWLVSSKSTESSFLESYIADQVRKGYPIYVVDKPLWEIKPAAYSGKMFKVAVGNKYVRSRVLQLDVTDEEIKSLKTQGFRVIDVPIEHRQAFDQDLDKALQDIAGISTSTTTKPFSVLKMRECYSDTAQNPFSSDVISLGMDDDLEIKDFFNSSLLPSELIGPPVFLHIDGSVSGDRTGISAVAIVGTKNVTTYGNDVGEQTVNEELLCQQVFSVGIQPPSDSEISFEKTRKFIYYLHDELGLNIKVISCDGFQSVDLRQILSNKGYETQYISLDRTPDGYDALRSAINDKRIVLLGNCPTLEDELSELNRDNTTRKYDHDSYHTKDIADSLAGAFLSASKYKDEYLFFNPSHYDYEGLNRSKTMIDKEQLQSILGQRLSGLSNDKLFKSNNSILSEGQVSSQTRVREDPDILLM